MKNFIKKNIYFILIILISVATRFYLLFVRGTYWFDELFSVKFSQLPWNNALRVWTYETNPPLHIFFLRFWIKLFGEGENATRILSFIFGILTVIFIYLIAKKLFSKSVALISALVISFSSIHIYMSTEARAYSLLCLLSLISFYLFYKLLTNYKQKYLIFYIIIQILLLYSHLTAVLIPVMQFFAVFIYKKENENAFKKIFWANFFAGLLFCAWFLPSLLNKLNLDSLNGWYFHNYQTDPSNILTTFVTLFILGNVIPSIFTTFSIVLAFILGKSLSFFNKNEKRGNPATLFLYMWAFVPIIMGTEFGIYASKFFLFTLPAFAILIGIGLESINNKILRRLVIIIFLAIMIPSTLEISINPIFDIKPIVQKIEQRETEKSITLVVPFQEEMTLKKYYNGKQPIVGIFPKDVGDMTINAKVTKYNWQTVSVKESEFEKWIRKQIDGKDKIFYVQYSGGIGPMMRWLWKNGWTLQGEIKAPGYVDFRMMEFYAPDNTTTASSGVQAN